MDFPAALSDPPAIIQVKTAPHRDPAIAVREEFDAAMRADTTAALDLFIRRHPDSPLAARARDELARLKRSGRFTP